MECSRFAALIGSLGYWVCGMRDLATVGIVTNPHAGAEQRVPCPQCGKGTHDHALGVNVESVSIRKAEIDASVELFARLRKLLVAG